ncbi:MAG: CPBP family intramembrane metalloprotease [Clostridiaceae bacterium]|jgi:membrane protease YdiL (CAAX protease family)|nr:CPBP family intramembrane metalloprotease [Clostridiaceae bacterium]
MEACNKKRAWIVIAIFSVFLYQQFCSKIGTLVANVFDYNTIDKYNVFAWISIHHIVQTLFALVPIAILSKTYNMDFGFKSGNKKIGLKYVRIFTMAMLAYITIISVIGYFSNQIMQYDYPLTCANVIGSLSFQLFLSGPSEEILFRALPISIIACFIPSEKGIRISKLHISWAIVISAVFFALAHIKWTVNPFSASFNYMQLLLSFVLGIMYGIVYQKSKSVIYPMMMHSFTNVAVVGAGYILSIIR